MRVRDVMSTQVSTVRAREAASHALRAMWDADCGSLPVLDDEGRVIAVVTDRDIAMTCLFRDQAPTSIPVADCMSKHLQACSPEDSLRSVEDVMRAHQIRRVPVLEGDRRLVGVLSMADIARKATGGREQRLDLGADDVAATLAIICTPRAETAAPH